MNCSFLISLISSFLSKEVLPPCLPRASRYAFVSVRFRCFMRASLLACSSWLYRQLSPRLHFPFTKWWHSLRCLVVGVRLVCSFALSVDVIDAASVSADFKFSTPGLSSLAVSPLFLGNRFFLSSIHRWISSGELPYAVTVSIYFGSTTESTSFFCFFCVFPLPRGCTFFLFFPKFRPSFLRNAAVSSVKPV